MILSISYDLNRADQEYAALYTKIKTAPGYIKAMDSYWFISTNESVETWSKRLLQVMDNNDHLFVVDITGQSRQGWMRKTIWEWLRKHDHANAYIY